MDSQGSEWIYKYIFETKWFRVAVVKTKHKEQQIKYKCPAIVLEFRKGNHVWTQKGIWYPK